MRYAAVRPPSTAAQGCTVPKDRRRCTDCPETKGQPVREEGVLYPKIILFVIPPAEQSVQTPQRIAVNRPGQMLLVLLEM